MTEDTKIFIGAAIGGYSTFIAIQYLGVAVGVLACITIFAVCRFLAAKQ